jgi:hypothetical protein
MYHHALMVIGLYLDRLVTDLKDTKPYGYEFVTRAAESLLHNTYDAVTSTEDKRRGWRDTLSTSDTDRKLIAYSVLRKGVSELYSGHNGTTHERTCLTCVCLWRCAGVVAAVERINTGKMAVARAQVQTLYRGQLSHRAAVIPHAEAELLSWHAVCPSCGTLSMHTKDKFQEAQQVVTKHRRAAAALTQHYRKTT